MRVCVYCGEEFSPIKPWQAYCSKPCRKKGWKVRNPEKHAEHMAKYREKNPALMTVLSANTHAKRRGAYGKITVPEWTNLLDIHGRRCHWCGTEDVKLGMDHLLPISCGGTHTIDNIVPCCGDCNRRGARCRNGNPSPMMAFQEERGFVPKRDT